MLVVLPIFKEIKGSAANVQDMVGSAVQVSGKFFQCFMILWEVLSMLEVLPMF